MPRELPNDLRLTNLTKLGNIGKVSKPHSMISWCPVFLVNEKLVEKKSLKKQIKFSCSALFYMKIRVFSHRVSNIL